MKNILALVMLLLSFASHARTYSLPADAGSFRLSSCSFSSGVVYCSSNVILQNNDVINITQPLTWEMAQDFTFGNNLRVNEFGNTSDLDIIVQANMNPGNGALINANLTVNGSINAANNASLTGDIQISGNLNLGNGATIEGNITVDGSLNMGNNNTISGDISATSMNIGQGNDIYGNLEGTNININGNNTTIYGNVNATGTVNNNGTITGYVNAPNVNDNSGGIEGETCDFNGNVGPCGSGAGVDHYALSYDGSALTCLAEPITVRACANSDCSTLAATTANFSVIAGSFSVSSNFDGSGLAQVNLPVATAGTYALAINSSATANFADQCVVAGSPAVCNITFVDSGFLVAWPQSVVDAGDEFSAQIQAVRTDTNTGACAAALTGSQTVNVTSDCTNPGSCAVAPSSAGTPLPEGTATPVTLSFDNAGMATLPLVHNDVGKLRVGVSFNAATGASLNGQSNDITVKPAAFAVTTTPAAAVNVGDLPGSPTFVAAGDIFTVQVVAMTSNEKMAPSYGQESPPQQPQIIATPSVAKPAPSGVLASTGWTYLGAGNGGYEDTQVSYNAVGVIKIRVQQNNYLGSGQGSEGTSGWVGRFIPAYFANTSTTTATLDNAQDDFTYIGQPLVFAEPFHLQLTPKTRQGQDIQNYLGDYFGFTASQKFVNREYSDSASTLTLSTAAAQQPTTTQDVVDALDTDAAFDIEIEDNDVRYNKPLTPIEPFDAAITLTLTAADLTDKDGVCFQQTAVGSCEELAIDNATGTELLYGRLRLEPAYASINQSIMLEFSAEYFTASGYFVQNLRDQSTAYSDAWFSAGAASVTGDYDFSDFNVTAVAAELVDGTTDTAQPLIVTPSVSSAGEITWSVNLDALGLPWLKYDWSPEAIPPKVFENPSSVIELGPYRGNDDIILQSEIAW
ncbi:hypothetical protein CWI84_07490 [Idiomarina tyrosinivorans]|uniref:DUF6701 domain-containing protein n=1 Tax=Idiomarina tyrosinivorans TaxID=1445662 RepID=A0A432ZQL2_9GAMM|nr:polymer-forming cytoskeletal protein [Idiomarina tyrosinivorans]RUO80132.1 hypothetical protein CWI84_07490 [Idiomarina tyrosinivorans]